MDQIHQGGGMIGISISWTVSMVRKEVNWSYDNGMEGFSKSTRSISIGCMWHILTGLG